MSSPAMILRESLIAAGLGVMRSANPSGPWPVYVSHLADDPDNAICVYDTPGIKDGRMMGTGETIWKHGLQVRVRGTAYPTIYAKMRAVADHLDAIRREVVALDGDTHTIISITQISDPLPLGQDLEGGRRESITLNATMTFTTA